MFITIEEQFNPELKGPIEVNIRYVKRIVDNDLPRTYLIFIDTGKNEEEVYQIRKCTHDCCDNLSEYMTGHL